MRNILLLGVAAFSFSGPAYAQTLAKVGGVPVTFEQVVAADPAAANDPSTREKVLVALINRQAVLNEAHRIGISQTSAYKSAMVEAGNNIAINLMAKNFVAAHPVSDQQITTVYNQVVSQPPPEQYRIRQIIVSSFSSAQSVLANIKNGQEFSNIAATISQDQSGMVGGELGWELAAQFPAPILKALKTLKVGEVAGPISLPQGYAVIQLMAMRTAPKPSLAQVKDEIRNELEQQEWINQVIKLRTAEGAHLVGSRSGG